MQTLSELQRSLVSSLGARLSAIAGVVAVVLGGSHARGRARPDSDIDLGLYYRESSPFSIDELRALARQAAGGDPVVTGFYEWGPWVNGGAWLTIEGQRVDLLYRSIEHVRARHRGRASGPPRAGVHPAGTLWLLQRHLPRRDRDLRAPA